VERRRAHLDSARVRVGEAPKLQRSAATRFLRSHRWANHCTSGSDRLDPRPDLVGSERDATGCDGPGLAGGARRWALVAWYHKPTWEPRRSVVCEALLVFRIRCACRSMLLSAPQNVARGRTSVSDRGDAEGRGVSFATNHCLSSCPFPSCSVDFFKMMMG